MTCEEFRISGDLSPGWPADDTLGSSMTFGCDLGLILCVLEAFWEEFDPA